MPNRLPTMIIMMFAHYVRPEWRVMYKTVQDGSGDFTNKHTSCGVLFITPPYSGFGIDNITMECVGLQRNWNSNPNTTDGHLYMVKAFVNDVFIPPLVQHRPTAQPYSVQIPGVLSTNARVKVVVKMPSDLERFTIICQKDSTPPIVSFRIRVFKQKSLVRFVHVLDSKDIDVESTTLFPYTADTPTTIELVNRDIVFQVNVDGNYFYNWTHRHSASEFERLRIWLPNVDDLLYLQSVSMSFPDL